MGNLCFCSCLMSNARAIDSCALSKLSILSSTNPMFSNIYALVLTSSFSTCCRTSFNIDSASSHFPASDNMSANLCCLLAYADMLLPVAFSPSIDFRARSIAASHSPSIHFTSAK
eukprot:jgi/Picsp_1/652/NSC_00648-R1_---NA---